MSQRAFDLFKQTKYIYEFLQTKLDEIWFFSLNCQTNVNQLFLKEKSIFLHKNQNDKHKAAGISILSYINENTQLSHTKFLVCEKAYRTFTVIYRTAKRTHSSHIQLIRMLLKNGCSLVCFLFQYLCFSLFLSLFTTFTVFSYKIGSRANRREFHIILFSRTHTIAFVTNTLTIHIPRCTSALSNSSRFRYAFLQPTNINFTPARFILIWNDMKRSAFVWHQNFGHFFPFSSPQDKINMAHHTLMKRRIFMRTVKMIRRPHIMNGEDPFSFICLPNKKKPVLTALNFIFRKFPLFARLFTHKHFLSKRFNKRNARERTHTTTTRRKKIEVEKIARNDNNRRKNGRVQFLSHFSWRC